MLTRNFKTTPKKDQFLHGLYVHGPGDNPKIVPTPAEITHCQVRCARSRSRRIPLFNRRRQPMLDFQKAVVEEFYAAGGRLKSYGGRLGRKFWIGFQLGK